MRVDIISFAALGLLSFVQADSYHYYDKPAKRDILGDILGQLTGNTGKDGGNGGNQKAKTVTETVRQTITVGAQAAAGGLNATAAVKTETVTVTQSAAAGDTQKGGQKAGNGNQEG